MENLDRKNQKLGEQKRGSIVTALIFIIAGVVIVGKNLNMIDYQVYRIIISWQMLLIAIGVYVLSKRETNGGLILIGIGAFFLFPKIMGFGHYWIHTYWPVAFIIIGIIMIVKILGRGENNSSCCGKLNWDSKHQKEYSSEEGFVVSSNTFGSVKQIVMDPVFKGASIKNTFGATILDLRHTTILEGETVINVDCTFGGVEIFMPGSWSVINEVNHIAGGSDDKRYRAFDSDGTGKKIILKGNITFGGLEIKS